jgi:hypothetical protein
MTGQVLPHQPGIGRQRRHQSAPLQGRLPLGGEVEEGEAGRPAARPAGQFGGVLRRERLAVELPEQRLHLPRPEAKVVGADLDQPARHPPPGDVEPRLAPRGGDDADIRRQVLHQPAELRFRLRPEQHVQVVDDQQPPPARPCLQHRSRRLRRPPASPGKAEGLGDAPLQPGQEGGGRAVGRVGPVPRHRHPGGLGELAQEGRLARSGGADDETETRLPHAAQHAVQPVPGQPPQARRGQPGPG